MSVAVRGFDLPVCADETKYLRRALRVSFSIVLRSDDKLTGVGNPMRLLLKRARRHFRKE